MSDEPEIIARKFRAEMLAYALVAEAAAEDIKAIPAARGRAPRLDSLAQRFRALADESVAASHSKGTDS